jgi:hypothetical protein
MTIQQISLFLENKPGHLSAICRTLAEAQINIVTLSLADTQQFGIVRLIVEEWARAQQVLEAAGFVVNVRDVVAVAVCDRPGGLAALLDTIQAAGVNIEYAFAVRRGEQAILVFRFDKAAQAVAALKAAGHGVLGGVDLFEKARA